MQKIIFSIFLFTMVSSICLGQAYESVLKYKKTEQPAIVIAYSYPEDIVENALKAKLADMHLNSEEKKGFIKYYNAVIPDISNAPVDYSFKIEESGKKEKATIIYMLMEGGNAVTDDASTFATNGKKFLDNLMPYVQKSNIIAEIKKQEAILVKEEGKLLDLKNEQSKIEKKLQDNQSEQNSQQKIIESQQQILQDLKAKIN